MTEEKHQAGFSEDEEILVEKFLAESVHDLSEFGVQRRLFFKQMITMGAGTLALQMLGGAQGLSAAAIAPSPEVPPELIENGVRVAFNVNGVVKSLTVDSRMTLLDTLRERLNLTGSKKGCDHGQCGACTVIVDGRRVLSCLTLAATCEGSSVLTIEGLAKAGQLHPMQAAFVKHDGFQCGYCTPGQICSAVALMNEAKTGEASYVTADIRSKVMPVKLSDEEIRERMSGNICRCGAYPNIVDAIREVHTGTDVVQHWQFLNDDLKPLTTNQKKETINETI